MVHEIGQRAFGSPPDLVHQDFSFAFTPGENFEILLVVEQRGCGTGKKGVLARRLTLPAVLATGGFKAF